MASVPQGEWADVHTQAVRSEPAWAGGFTDDQGTPYDGFMYLKRVNVEVHQCWLAVQEALMAVNAISQKVDALAARLDKA